MPSEDTFIEAFLFHLKPGWKVLDLGAGDGRHASRFAERGCEVTAVDRREPTTALPGIRWIRQSAEDFVRGLVVNYNAVFCRNLFQFIDKPMVLNVVVPRLQKHCGLIAIRTFWKEPDPSLARSLRSLYELDDFQKIFKDWRVILASQHDKVGVDLQGETRRFFLTDFIAHK